MWQSSNKPTGLTATPNPPDNTKITLAWTAPGVEPVSYNIERKDGSAGSWYSLDTISAPAVSYDDTTGACDIDYFYRINAVDSGSIVSDWSNEADAIKCETGPPGKASNPSPADFTTKVPTNTPALTWTADAAAQTHDVYFGTDSASLTFIGNQATTSYAPGAMLANTDYYWRIDEKNLSGTTTGDVWTFKTGVSVTLIPVRSPTRGTITYPSEPARAWNEVSWHDAGEVLTSPFRKRLRLHG